MKHAAVLFMLILVASSGYAQDGFSYEQYISSTGDTLNYRLLRPQTDRKGRKYPLVLFLHGAGERGSDNSMQLKHGGQMWLNPKNMAEYPAFVLFPQCPSSGYWAYSSRPESFIPSEMPLDGPLTPVMSSVHELVLQYMSMPQVDRDRIYVVGLSMGAMATYDLVARYPDLFAAAVPICGTVNPLRLEAASKVSFRIFHGDADDVVPVEASRQAYLALKAADADVEYIEFPGCGHGSWNPAFCLPDFMKWLFEQER